MKKEQFQELEEVNSLSNKVSIYRFTPYNDYFFDHYGPHDEYYVAAVDGELSMLNCLPQGVYRLTKLK